MSLETPNDTPAPQKRRISIARILVLLVPALIIFGILLSRVVPKGHWSPHVACISNLKRIEDAKATSALEYKKLPTHVPIDADLFGKGKYLPEKPRCPKGGTYTLGAVNEKARCSIPGHELP